MTRLDGKVAFITGGARGQGRSHALTLAAHGARIVVTDICRNVPGMQYDLATEEDLAETQRLVEELDQPCLSLVADSRDSAKIDDAVAQAIERFGTIDILLVNHGIAVVNPWDTLTDEAWERVIDINLTSVWKATRPVIPHMIENGGGAIVLTSSAAGLRAFPNMAHYVASKFGVVGLTQALAQELAPHSIRVNAVCPTNVATTMIHNPTFMDMFAGKQNATLEDMAFPAQSMMLLPTPWIQAADVSNAILYLVSDEARYITGMSMPLDAGSLVQPPGIPPIAAERLGAVAG